MKSDATFVDQHSVWQMCVKDPRKMNHHLKDLEKAKMLRVNENERMENQL